MINIVPPASVYKGRSYGDWSAKWWQWAYSIDKDHNPVNDTDGKFSGNGQSGPVWFLAGTFGAESPEARVTRSCAMPAGRAIFICIFNCCFNTEEDGADLTELELLNKAREDVDTAILLDITIDGQDIQDLQKYRVESPLFTVKVPSNPARANLKGGETQGISDGYWLLLEPPNPGLHTIHLHAKTPNFETEAIYNLVVSTNFSTAINDRLRPPER
jgi:hypothetical protein